VRLVVSLERELHHAKKIEGDGLAFLYIQGNSKKKLRAGKVLKSTQDVLLVSTKMWITTLGIHQRNKKILFWR
jgi:hypothetical protein